MSGGPHAHCELLIPDHPAPSDVVDGPRTVTPGRGAMRVPSTRPETPGEPGDSRPGSAAVRRSVGPPDCPDNDSAWSSGLPTGPSFLSATAVEISDSDIRADPVGGGPAERSGGTETGSGLTSPAAANRDIPRANARSSRSRHETRPRRTRRRGGVCEGPEGRAVRIGADPKFRPKNLPAPRRKVKSGYDKNGRRGQGASKSSGPRSSSTWASAARRAPTRGSKPGRRVYGVTQTIR